MMSRRGMLRFSCLGRLASSACAQRRQEPGSCDMAWWRAAVELLGEAGKHSLPDSGSRKQAGATQCLKPCCSSAAGEDVRG